MKNVRKCFDIYIKPTKEYSYFEVGEIKGSSDLIGLREEECLL